MHRLPFNLFIFDLDGTLAYSKAPLGDDMAAMICKLLEKSHVAVISGASFNQFKDQFIDKLHCSDLANLHILPTNAAAYYNYDKNTGLWHKIYEKLIPSGEFQIIERSIKDAIAESKVKIPEKLYGKQIENRGSQITVSLLGQEAPLSEKSKFDPDQKKRMMIRERLVPLIPKYNIGIGGTTSLDITEKGIDKEFGIYELLERLNLKKSEALYVGDAIFLGGNDYPAVRSGIETLKVKDPKDTKEKINSMIGAK